VICFGLFHGLIFLPVLLSLFGPDPYPFAYSREEDFEDFEKHPKPKIVEMQPLSANSLQVKDAHCITNGLKKNGIFNANDPLLTDSSHLDSDGKQI